MSFSLVSHYLVQLLRYAPNMSALAKEMTTEVVGLIEDLRSP